MWKEGLSLIRRKNIGIGERRERMESVREKRVWRGNGGERGRGGA